jgi:hypothetical protein
MVIMMVKFNVAENWKNFKTVDINFYKYIYIYIYIYIYTYILCMCVCVRAGKALSQLK